MLGSQQIFIGAIAIQHQRMGQFTGQALAGFFIVLDNFDLIILFQRQRQSAPDITAADYHHALGGFIHMAQFFQYRTDIFRGGDEK